MKLEQMDYILEKKWGKDIKIKEDHQDYQLCPLCDSEQTELMDDNIERNVEYTEIWLCCDCGFGWTYTYELKPSGIWDYYIDEDSGKGVYKKFKQMERKEKLEQLKKINM